MIPDQTNMMSATTNRIGTSGPFIVRANTPAMIATIRKKMATVSNMTVSSRRHPARRGHALCVPASQPHPQPDRRHGEGELLARLGTVRRADAFELEVRE